MPGPRNRSAEYARRKLFCTTHNLCLRCRQPKGPNKWLCDGCLKRTNNKDRQNRQVRKSEGLCKCGAAPSPGFEYCDKCREDSREQQAKRRQTHQILGLCITCGNQPAQGQKTCADCQKRATTSTLARYYGHITDGVCAFCGSEKDKSEFRCDNCHSNHLDSSREYWHAARNLVIAKYGGGCRCCGESTPEFIEIDHINNDGKVHRQLTGRHVYTWIIKHNFPGDLQLLCAKCNRGRARFGICPHHQAPSPTTGKAAIRRKRRQETISRYGDGCKCCGENHWAFLEFDHVNDDGAEHRLVVKSAKLVSWIIANNYPDTIQLLCSNCNKAKGLYGTCPHQKEIANGTNSKEVEETKTNS